MENKFLTEDDKPKKKVINTIWAEKFRPSNINEFIGNETIKNELKKILDNNDLCNLILHGPPGTGKSSMALMIVRNIKCDYIFINASDETGIDNIRNKIKAFASTTGINTLKVVVFDEADALSYEASLILKRFTEEYSLHTRFIFTTNYIGKILPAIQSRCQVFEVIPPSKKEIGQHLVNILTKENIKYELMDLGFVINTFYPDIRKIINYAQQSCINGKLVIAKENAGEVDFKNKLVELLKTPNKPGIFTEIRQLIVNSDINSYDIVYRYLFDNIDIYAKGKEATVILEIAESIYQSSMVFEKEITFLSCIIKILRAIKEHK